jgi:superfamily II DNA or RNA helicase
MSIDIIRHNKVITQGLPGPLVESIKKHLTIMNPKYLDAIKFGRWPGQIDKFIIDYEEDKDILVIPRGMFRPLTSILERNNLKYNLMDTRLSYMTRNIKSNIILRDSQIPIAKSIEGKEEGVIVAPPGSGKTVIGMYVISRIGQPTLWVTHTNKLFNQAIERASQFLNIGEEDIGRIRQNERSIGKNLTVAMLQTLYARDLSELVHNFGMVVVDEVHHLPARSFLSTVTQFPARYMFGLTATDYRKDNLQGIMFQNIGPVIYRLVHEEAREEVMTPKIKRVYTGIPFLYVDGYFQRLITDVVSNDIRNRMIVRDVASEVAKGNDCIILSGRVKHCHVLLEILKTEKIEGRIAVGKGRTSKVNEEAVKDVVDGKSKVLIATYSLLSEGFDCPKLNRLFLTTPVRSRGLYVQSVGRILRQSPGKEDAVVYDYIDENSLLYNQAGSREQYSLQEWNAIITEERK